MQSKLSNNYFWFNLDRQNMLSCRVKCFKWGATAWIFQNKKKQSFFNFLLYIFKKLIVLIFPLVRFIHLLLFFKVLHKFLANNGILWTLQKLGFLNMLINLRSKLLIVQNIFYFLIKFLKVLNSYKTLHIFKNVCVFLELNRIAITDDKMMHILKALL